MKLPFIDLTPVTKRIAESYLKRVEQLLQQANFVLSSEVEEFEKRWANFVGTGFCIGASSGADALYLSLLAVGVGPGDEVITQGNAYNASVTAILRVGAVPRFADIDGETLQVDVNKIEPLVGKKTKAILPVHLYGQSGDMAAVMKIAGAHGLSVIEDCAQAHGATFEGKKLGSFGRANAFSFYPTKNLGAFGEAGAVVTDSREIYEEILMRRNLGQKEKNDHRLFGTNMRLDPIQAIALTLKLEFLDEVTAARQAAGKYYDQLISRADLPVKPVTVTIGATHVYHLYVVRLQGQDRSKIQERLRGLDVETQVHYPVPVYRQPFYRGSVDACPITDETSKQILSLPMFFGITQEQQERVIGSLKQVTS